MAEELFGRQTPTKSVTLPYEVTHGPEAVELYNKTKRTAQPWQELLCSDIMATNADGLWVHTKFGYSVPRRNGKNEVVSMRELWGLKHGEKILHTAHRTTTVRTAWERLEALLDESGESYSDTQSYGRETVSIAGGGRVEFRTRTSKGGLGEGFDLLIIDEAQEYLDDQESSLKYVVSDSANPQTLFCGTPPTAVSSGTVFTKLRQKTLEGASINTGWAEWSVDEMSDPKDRSLWYETNPSMGYILNERKVQDEITNDDVDFNIQRLGLWIRYNQKSAISQQDWSALLTEQLPKLKGPLCLGIKYGNDGANVAASVAVKTEDGKIFVEALDCRPIRNGNAWLLAFMNAADIKSVVIDGANGQQVLEREMKDMGLKLRPYLPKVGEIIEANALFEQNVVKKVLLHKEQPSLTAVITNCEKRAIGSNGGFGYKAQQEEREIALLDSVILAQWGCSNFKEARKQHIGY